MPRTTVNIDDPIWKDLKKLQKREGKPLGRLISELLAGALAALRSGNRAVPEFRWVSRSMEARLDLLDKEAVRAALEKSSAETR